MIEKHGSLIYGTEDEIMEAIREKERQELCDAISRKAVLQAVSEGCQEFRGVYGRCEELINALPSVTQKSEYFIDGVHAMGYREGYKDAQKQWRVKNDGKTVDA